MIFSEGRSTFNYFSGDFMNYLMIGLGILLAAVAHMIIGSIWYAPMVFGTQWMRLSKVAFDMEKMKKGLLAGFFGALVMAAIMVCFMIRLPITTFVGAFNFGWMVWLGFVAPVALEGMCYVGYPMQLFFINSGCRLLSMLAMSLILVNFI